VGKKEGLSGRKNACLILIKTTLRDVGGKTVGKNDEYSGISGGNDPLITKG